MIFPSWSDTFVALQQAQTREELWSVLVTPHGIKSTSQWEEPFVLFSRFHRHDPNDATVTALLLCTDHRWRKAAHRLIRRLADSALLDDTALDELAEAFLAPEGTIDVHLVLVDDKIVATGELADAAVAAQRTVWPPLRRWAATRQVHRDPARWRDLLDMARSSPSRDASALAAGVMDAADKIHLDDRAEALEHGLGWGSGAVRLATLPGIASLHGVDRARARAAEDPSEKVRAWATKHPTDPSDAASRDETHPDLEPDDMADQPTLFDPSDRGEPRG